MTNNRLLLAAAAALMAVGLGAGSTTSLVAATTAAQEQSRSDQGEARREMRAGNQLSLREIERRILPRMRGSEYLGPSYDSTARAYRLKFIREGRVTYIDVDARTGRIINRSN
ncbi:hypothetical protein CD351_07690 [Erythrobacter sp. KY5]|uniref:PepSY domain-containing protein n=1 Tax=Erythrobacter sp. KY5 TaxID=2011159 RepID=UPI000DBF13DD|nr:PepSY domain-containing protein [Erythrobacter sp. KY5]AWW74307.1 hypothetical protein CD351_07690 [Erythrobacter sp. KY5]